MHRLLPRVAVLLAVGLCFLSFAKVKGFLSLSPPGSRERCLLRSSSPRDGEAPPPSSLRVSEIKAELDLRKVSHADCFDKESLMERLTEARATGRGDVDILNMYQRNRLEESLRSEGGGGVVDEEMLKSVVSADGSLPGGLKPEEVMKMMENPELQALFANPKMNEIMKAVMGGGGPDAIKQFMDDPEAMELLQRLNRAMGV